MNENLNLNLKPGDRVRVRRGLTVATLAAAFKPVDLTREVAQEFCDVPEIFEVLEAPRRYCLEPHRPLVVHVRRARSSVLLPIAILELAPPLTAAVNVLGLDYVVPVPVAREIEKLRKAVHALASAD